MIEIRRILCPVDFSEGSRRALDHAIAIARWYESEITVLHVSVPDVSGFPPQGGFAAPGPRFLAAGDRERLIAELKRFTEIEGAGGSIHVMVTEGSAVKEILAQAQSLPADLLVMGTHGLSGFERLMLGSVTEKVLRKAICPVLTVPPKMPDAVPVGPALFKHVLCPVDFSDSSLKALSYAMSLAQEAAARLTVAHVLELPTEHEAARYFTDLAEYRRRAEMVAWEDLRNAVPDAVRTYCHVEEIVLTGKPYREILSLAADRQSELIVMGVHGRGAADVLFFGSTTQHVVRQATCPVLTIRTN